MKDYFEMTGLSQKKRLLSKKPGCPAVSIYSMMNNISEGKYSVNKTISRFKTISNALLVLPKIHGLTILNILYEQTCRFQA